MVVADVQRLPIGLILKDQRVKNYGSSHNTEYEGKLSMSGKQQSNGQIIVGMWKFFLGR